MTNTDRLTGLIDQSGLKLAWIAEKLGISRFALQKKLTNKNEFKASEIGELCRLLNIESSQVQEIFFVTK